MSIAILITARLKSTRLKEKVIRPILGRPMLSHMLQRLRLSKLSDRIILCTSTVPQDDRLFYLAQFEKVSCFRGDPDDVLARILAAASYYKVDKVISCTTDNPFVDPIYIDKLIEFHLEENNDFSRTEGLPFGTFAYALKREAIKKACKIKDTVDTEVWGGYFTETNLFKCGTLIVEDLAVNWPELRLTVDTEEDFKLISEVFRKLHVTDKVFTLEEIVKLCRNNPDLHKINAGVLQQPGKPIKLKIK